MALIMGFSFTLLFFISNSLSMLLTLFLVSLLMAFIFSVKSTWMCLVFIMVYIGGVLVLAIYSILSTTNWNFDPSWVLSFLVLLMLVFSEDSGYSFYCGESLGLSLSMISGLLLLLLVALFILVTLIKI